MFYVHAHILFSSIKINKNILIWSIPHLISQMDQLMITFPAHFIIEIDFSITMYM